MTTITLVFGYLVYNDYIAPVPDMTGRWKFTLVYQNTEDRSFQDLEVTYQILLTQNDLKLLGTGEKLSDRGPSQDKIDYHGDRRTNIEVTGTITRRFFSPDQLVLQYKETGLKRESSTLLRLNVQDNDTLCGCFLTTVADTSGPVGWKRVSSLVGIYEPVDLKGSCQENTDCSAGFLN